LVNKLIVGILSIILSIVIVFHHYCVHIDDPDKSLIEKIIQIDDINNHETFALMFLAFGIGIIYAN